MSAPSLHPDSPRVLDALRAATGHLHRRLEQRLPFFSPHLDRARYTRLVEAYYGFYQPLETALLASALAPDGLDLPARCKVPALVRDLHALGVDAPALGRLPLCEALPAIDSRAACLGVLYVLEGATLGGQILRREMQARLGLDEHSGAAFLDVYGADTGRRWKAFLQRLDELPADPACGQSAAQAAAATFSAFEQWLEGRQVLS